MAADLSVFGDLEDSKLVELIRVAETAERYEDMCELVTKLVKKRAAAKTQLNQEERNLLSVAFKNVVGAKRASWRTLSGGFDDVDQALIDSYKALVEKELEAVCQKVLALLKEQLLPLVDGTTDEVAVFYNKMCGDYYRYMSEFNDSDANKAGTEEFYKKAMEAATESLSETHPTRLGLALNFSVCYYEILKQPEKACELAKKSFDAAIEKLDQLDETSYKDSTLIMQLLRDNLTLWTSEAAGDEAEA